jgi:hypothetical protein
MFAAEIRKKRVAHFPHAASGAPAHWRSPRPAPKLLIHCGGGAKEAEAVVAQIRMAGGRANAIAANLAAPDGPHRLAKQARASWAPSCSACGKTLRRPRESDEPVPEEGLQTLAILKRKGVFDQFGIG